MKKIYWKYKQIKKKNYWKKLKIVGNKLILLKICKFFKIKNLYLLGIWKDFNKEKS